MHRTVLWTWRVVGARSRPRRLRPCLPTPLVFTVSRRWGRRLRGLGDRKLEVPSGPNMARSSGSAALVAVVRGLMAWRGCPCGDCVRHSCARSKKVRAGRRVGPGFAAAAAPTITLATPRHARRKSNLTTCHCTCQKRVHRLSHESDAPADQSRMLMKPMIT